LLRRSKGKSGASNKAAVLLGLKAGTIEPAKEGAA
jgi:hypothetical protein